MSWQFEDEQVPAAKEANKSSWVFEDEAKSPAPTQPAEEGNGLLNFFNQAVTAQAGFGPATPEVAQNLATFSKGAAHGASAGITGYIPGLEPNPESEIEKFGQIAGEVVPITGLLKVFGSGATKLAMRSPIFKKQLESLFHIIGAGAAGVTLEAGKELVQGRLPTDDDLIDHGVAWASLEAGLRTLGFLGRAAGRAAGHVAERVGLWAKETGKPEWKVINDALNEARISGADIEADDRVAAKVLSVLERNPVIEDASNPVVANPREVPVRKGNVLYQGRGLEFEYVPAGDREPLKAEIVKLNSEASAIAEPYQPGEFTINEVNKQADEAVVQAELDSVGTKAKNSNAFGENIKKDVEGNLEAAESLYKPKYTEAEEAAAEVNTNPKQSGYEASQLYNKIVRLKTNAEGAKKVVSTIETSLEDMGYTVTKNKNGFITNITPSKKGVSVDRLMDLGRRMNKIVSYDNLDKSVRDTLKPLIAQIKQDVRLALKDKPAALEAYEQAETLFGETAKVYGKDSIRKIRSTENLDSIRNQIKSPSNLKDMREALGKSQFEQVEREVVDHINNLPYNKGREYYRNVKDLLSDKAQKVSENILKRKSPIVKTMTPRQKAIGVIKEDLANAFATGARPDKTLKLWKTDKGQRLVKEVLHNSPQGKETLKYLKDQSFFDFTRSFVSDTGEVNLKKLKDLIKDPATKENIRLIGGEDAVRFFENFEKYANGIKQNMKILDRISPYEISRIGPVSSGKGKQLLERAGIRAKELRKPLRTKEQIAPYEVNKKGEPISGERGQKLIKQISANEVPIKHFLDKADEFFGEYGKGMLGALGVLHYGTIPGAAAALAYKILYRLASKRNPRQIVRALSKPEIRRQPAEAFMLLHLLDQELEQEQ